MWLNEWQIWTYDMSNNEWTNDVKNDTWQIEFWSLWWVLIQSVCGKWPQHLEQIYHPKKISLSYICFILNMKARIGHRRFEFDEIILLTDSLLMWMQEEFTTRVVKAKLLGGSVLNAVGIVGNVSKTQMELTTFTIIERNRLLERMGYIT